MRALLRSACWVGGFVLITYGLVHLLVWPGAPLGDGGPAYDQLRWNGDSWSWQPGWLPPAVVWSAGGVLLTVAVLGCVLGGLALLGLPGVRRYPLLTSGLGAACSLVLFAVAWPGLEPDPAEFVAAPVLSGVLFAVVGVAALLRRRPTDRDTPTDHGISVGRGAPASDREHGGPG